MGDQQQRRRQFALELEQQAGDFFPGARIEIAGRLVGKQQAGTRSQRAGKRHALLLAAGKLNRIMAGAVGQADPRQHGLGAGKGIGDPGKFQRHGDIFQRRHIGDKMERLKDDADMAAAKQRQRVFVHGGYILAGNMHGAGIGALQPGDNREQARFSRPAGADQANRGSGLDAQAGAAQNMNPRRASAEAEMHICKIDHSPVQTIAHWLTIRLRIAATNLRLFSHRPIAKNFQFRDPAKPGLLAAVLMSALLAAPSGRASAGEQLVTLVAFGDSLTAGLGLEREQAFPARLEAALRARGHEVRIVNAGVSGDTASAGLSRLDWTLSGIAGEIGGVVLELGANDALRGIDPRITRDALDGILARLNARGIKVLLAGMRAPPNMGREFGGKFDTIYPQLAEKHGVLLYPFFLDGVAAQAEFNQGDGIHPNTQGVAVIVAGMTPYAEELIALIRAGREMGK